MADVCDPNDASYNAAACVIAGGIPGQPGSAVATGSTSGPKPYESPPQYSYPDTFVGRQIPGTGQTLQPGSLTIDPNSGLVVFWNGTSFSLAPEYVQKAFSALGGAGGAGADNALGYAQLAQREREFMESIRQFNEELKLQGINAGLDAESARRQALTTLITNRNNTAVDVANLSNDVAKTAAQFAANPRDAVAELMYRNQVGGNAFGDMTNDSFGEYGRALAEKAASIFSPVQGDLNQARLYRDSIPPLDFLGPEQRSSLGLPPTPAQGLTGGVSMQPVGAGTPAPAGSVNGLQALMDRLNSMSDADKDAFRKWTTATAPLPKMDMGGIVNARTAVGDAPTSTEGGLNLNLFEPAMVVGMDSGKVYATLAEPRPDGTRRGEQLIVKPLKSEVEKDKKLAEGNKAVTQSFGVSKMAEGGSITAGQSPDDFMQQLSTYLGSLGGSGGGTGSYSTPLPSARLLAGDPWASLEDDPVAMDYTLAGYSALGIDPRTIQATIKKFTPNSAQRQGQTNVRAGFL